MNICKVAGCSGKVRAHGFCNKHMLRYLRHGDPHFRKKSANGEGGFSTQGYRIITVNCRRILEHRHIMEVYLGRVLTSDEIVHHIDGNKLNNSIENLVIHSRRDHVNRHPESLDNLSLGPRRRKGTI